MGQLLATFHNKQLNLKGHSQFAFTHLKMAFFIGLKNPIKRNSISIFDGQYEFDCPVNVPYPHFCGLIRPIYLGKANLSLGIYYPLLLIFAGYGSLMPIFYKEI